MVNSPTDRGSLAGLLEELKAAASRPPDVGRMASPATEMTPDGQLSYRTSIRLHLATGDFGRFSKLPMLKMITMCLVW